MNSVKVPLIAGAVYERRDPRTGLPERVVVVATQRMAGGYLEGVAFSVDSAAALTFIEGDESMASWSLVAKPVELDEPISGGDLVEHEVQTLRRQLRVMEEERTLLELRIKQQSFDDDVLVEGVRAAQKWSDIGRPYGLGWQEVKARWVRLLERAKDGDSSPAALAALAIGAQREDGTPPAPKE